MSGIQSFLEAGWQNVRVLIADDFGTTRDVLARSLKMLGLDTIEACDGTEALYKAEVEHPDLILLDLHMPGMDGEQTLTYLKRSEGLRGIPVVMITGDSDVSTESRLCGLGAESFLHKPFSLADLASSVQYGLEHRQRDTDTGPAAASLPFQARLLRSVGSHLPISYGVIF